MTATKKITPVQQKKNSNTKKKNTNTKTGTKTKSTKKNPVEKNYNKKKNTNISKSKKNQSNTKKQKKTVKINKNTSKNDKKIISNTRKIQILKKCKGVLIFFKKVKNSIINKYNIIKRKTKSQNKIKKTNINYTDDELILLKYKDYPGLGKISVFFINRIRVMINDMKKFKKKFKYGTLKDKILIILMCCLIIGFSSVVVFCTYIIISAPDISEERLYKNNSTVLLDINGNEFARLGSENREKVTYDELPEVLVDAIVATEDSRFFQHNGLDIARFTKAFIGQVMGRPDAGGGSTLTMQVSKNAATSSTSSGIKGIIRKFTDIYLSVFVFEKKYTKEQIMEFYVNIPLLGARAYGVEQASQTYFGKSVSELNLTEAALIAGLFQAPSAYNPFINPKGATARRNTVLNLMYRHGYITEEERDLANAVPVESLLIERNNNTLHEYVGFIDTLVSDVEKKTGQNPDKVSMKIWTTLDPEKQDVINGIYEGKVGSKTYKWKNDVVQAAMAVIDVKTGALVAVGAGRNKTGERTKNYAYLRRQPGSTAKPVLDYGPAIEYLNWGTGQTIIDDQMTYTGGASIRNFDSSFKGVMTIKEALAQSRNIPALYTFQQTTNEQKAEFVANLGWTPETSNGTILESCSIGGFDGVTTIESAAAFATFARGGTYIEPFTFTKIEFTDTDEVYEHTPKKVQAMSSETAYLVNTILRYAVTSGRISAGSVSGTDIAAKTGTSTISSADAKTFGIKSKVIGDYWEVAYSPDYAISLWYGYEPRLSKDYYLTAAHQKERGKITRLLTTNIMKKNSRFKRPSGITTATIELGTDPVQLASDYTPKELKSTEYFKKGSAPSTVSNRFDKLEDPSNLTYSSTSTSVTLSWNAAPTPKAIDTEYLTDYFNSSKVYKRWADKYLKERIQYNNTTFGSFGYHIYLKNNNGIRDLGFTTNTTFTTNVQFDSSTTFIVKSSYQKFTANQSSGISVIAEPNSQTPITPDPSTPPTTTEPESNLEITYLGPSCSTVDDYKALGSSATNKITVKENGIDVTNKASITIDCFLASDPETGGQCVNLISGKEYIVNITVNYKKANRTKIINLKNKC